MILAAGLTPAWQQIVLLDSFRPGELNRAREVHWCASGKVLNVGIALGSLGATPKTLSLVGGETGIAIRREFREAGFDARWIETNSPTRVCTTILDVAAGASTELVENSGNVTPAELKAFTSAYVEEAAIADVVVLSGSLPAGAPVTFYRELLASSPARAVLDIRGPELLAALEFRPFVVKPNREELAHTFGKSLADDGDLFEAMRDLNAHGADWVVVTQGKDPVWVTSASKTYQLAPPAANVVNPIGCGDCFAAGIARGLSLGNEPLESIRLGMAAAADNLHNCSARLDAARVQQIAKTIT